MKLSATLDVPRQGVQRPRPDWLRLKLPSFVALILLWQGAAMLIGDPVLVPTPLATIAAFYRHLVTGELPLSLAPTSTCPPARSVKAKNAAGIRQPSRPCTSWMAGAS